MPGGYFAASTLIEIAAPFGERLFEVTKSYLEKLASAPIVETKGLNQEQEVADVLEGIGFIDIVHKTDDLQLYFLDELDWWEAQWSIFRRGFLERLDPDSLEAYKRQVLPIVRDCIISEGVPINVSVRYSKARKPATPI
jgi:hypothetical protein